MDAAGMKKSGLTLVELLISITITSILAGTVVLMLKSALDSYNFVQGEMVLQKVLDETLEEIFEGGFDDYGIKDSIEILNAASKSITSAPLWVDESHNLIPLKPNTEMILNRPFKAGATLPIAEASSIPRGNRAMRRWYTVPITFILGAHADPYKPDDIVMLNKPLPAGSSVRFVYQADAAYFPDCRMEIKWAGDRIIRKYNGKEDIIPKHSIKGVAFTDCDFQYFDNTNTLIPFKQDGSMDKELLPQITAVRVTLKAKGMGTNKEVSTFISLRNTRSAGAGIVIRKGTKFKIPDSKHIRMFSLSNVIGVKEGDCIDIEAVSKSGESWKVRMELGIKDNVDVIKKYSIEYPSGMSVYSETINLTTDIPFNFLTLGNNGLYDYDFDKGSQNIVNLEGEVTLTVTRMDCSGAALFIRP